QRAPLLAKHLAGHHKLEPIWPPVDGGTARGIDWRPYRLKFVMAGEVVSEEWRTLVGERVGSDRPCYDSASLYGTADAGVLANETPLSICIRRFLAGNPAAARA